MTTERANKQAIASLRSERVDHYWQTKDLYITFPSGESDKSFFAIMPVAYNLLDYELYFGIWLMNFPYCAVNEFSRDHIVVDNKSNGEKIASCKSCKYVKLCPGFPSGYLSKFGKGEVKPVPDLPAEVMLEIEPRCNYKCSFCYNHNSFASEGREFDRLSSQVIKNIIDQVKDADIKIIRFTGGEPMLHPDIFKLLRYGKKKGFEVRLNTNGSLINERNINKMKDLIDNVLLPIESYKIDEEAKITGYPSSLKKKVRTIELFNRIDIPVIRVGTVASIKNIADFNQLAKFILSLPIHEWELYRPISNQGVNEQLSALEIEKLVTDMVNVRAKTNIKVSIANSLPFCALKDLNKINSISTGALYDDGHSRMVVDPRGFIKPHYFNDTNLGDMGNVMGAWNHEYMRKMRNLEFLPDECRDCNYKFKCRGGSRFEANISHGNYIGPDPLANYNYK